MQGRESAVEGDGGGGVAMEEVGSCHKLVCVRFSNIEMWALCPVGSAQHPRLLGEMEWRPLVF